MLLAVTVVGIFAIPFFLGVLYVLNILGAVVGAIRASDGKFFRFPFTLRFLK
jgi:uncharacterized Tic20 family protein